MPGGVEGENSRMTSPLRPEDPTRVGDYDLVARIGKGGQGVVYLGKAPDGTRVAVKVMETSWASNSRARSRFAKEIEAASKVAPFCTAALLDSDINADPPYIVSEYIEGPSLRDAVLRDGPRTGAALDRLAISTATALVAIHQAGVIHRDFKPANVLLGPDGPRVIDFGIARHSEATVTATDSIVGTPAYMAPEQVESGIASPASDLYALGCTLHEMLSGSPVFDGRTSYSVMDKQVKQPPTPLRRLRSEVPAELERLVLDLLEKDPRQRPPHARRVFERLLPFVEELAPLPEVIDLNRRECATRLYATVLTRASLGEPSGVAAPAPPRIAAAPHERPRDPASRGQLTDARRRAARLVQEARYRQAAEVLTTALTTARRALGDTHQDVVDARLELADALYDGGDYHAAAPVYAELAERFAGRDPDRALHCRMREAGCHALTGEPEVALRMVQKLLREEQPARPATDPKMITLRRQVGLLQRALGHRDDARRTLSELLDDLRRWYGPTHPTVVELRAQVEALSRPGRP